MSHVLLLVVLVIVKILANFRTLYPFPEHKETKLELGSTINKKAKKLLRLPIFYDLKKKRKYGGRGTGLKSHIFVYIILHSTVLGEVEKQECLRVEGMGPHRPTARGSTG